MKSIKQQVIDTYNTNSAIWHNTRISNPSNFKDKELLKRNRSHLYIEKPAMELLLPDLTGKKVLMLGCGSGEETEIILKKNTKNIVGIDISSELIKIAQSKFPEIEFHVMDAEELAFSDDTFDFVYSSLILDYFESWEKVLSEVNRVMKKGGVFQFSNIHPVKWGAETITKNNDRDIKSVLLGLEKNEKTGEQVIFGDYLNNVKHEDIWFKDMPISYFTRPISLMINDVLNSGFKILSVHEPKTTIDAKVLEPLFYESGQKIPSFIIFVCEKE